MSGHTIECPCGTVLRGPDEDAVVAEAQNHARAVHDMELTDDDVLASAAAHAASAHGMAEVPDEVVEAIRAGITDA